MTISTRTAIASSITGRYLTMGLQFVSTLVLARLLTPEDIGIYTAGFSIVALAHLFRDFGLNQYIIQEKELSKNAIRTTFTLSLISAWLLGVLVFLAAGLAADFFNAPGVEQLVKLLSINFFLIPFGSVTMAILRKNLRFHITTSIGFIAVLFGITVAIYSAYIGKQYLCLAYGAITETSTIVLLSVLFRPKGMKYFPSLLGAKRILNFASIVGAGNIVTQFAYSATDALIARLLGLSSLGFFSRAWGTFDLFNHLFVSSIRPVMLPLLSRDSNHLPKFTEGYSRAVCYSFVFAWPFFCFLFLYTFETMRVLYGPQWDASIPLVKILCLAGLTLPATIFSESLFIAFGRPGIALRIQLGSNITKVVLVLVACQYGLRAVCAALVAYFLVRLLISSFYAKRIIGIRYGDMFSVACQAIPCLLFTMAPTLVASRLMQGHIDNVFAEFSILVSLAFIGWLAGLRLSKHPFFDEVTIIYRRLIRDQSAANPN